MVVDLVDKASFTLGRPTRVGNEALELSSFDAARFSTYSIGPEGRSLFLVRTASTQATSRRLMLLCNWQLDFANDR